MQPDVSWQFRLMRLGSALGSLDSCRRSMPWQFRLMRHDGSDGRNDERLVLARDKKFLIGVVTVRNTEGAGHSEVGMQKESEGASTHILESTARWTSQDLERIRESE